MFCPNCGSEIAEGTKFCSNCGATLTDDIAAAGNAAETSTETYTGAGADNTGEENVQRVEAYTDYSSNYGAANDVIFGNGTNRNIVLCIIFTIISCGIYGLYWMYVLNEEINSLSGKENATSGGLVILFTIITCGIYGLYWYYVMGERTDEIKKRLNMNASGSNILFLILGLIGLGIVNYAIMQDAVNKAVGEA